MAVELPDIGSQEPRPAQNLSFCECGNDNGLALRRKDLNSYLALADQIKSVGGRTFPKDVGARFKTDIRGAANDQVQVSRIEAREKRTLGNNAFKVFHSSLLPG